MKDSKEPIEGTSVVGSAASIIGRDEEFAWTPYERVAMLFFGPHGSEGARMVAICAEPGMGRHDVISGVLAQAERAGLRVTRKGLGSTSAEDATRILTRAARLAEHGDGRAAIAFDDIPASDEGCIVRQARALRRLVSSGASVIFSIAPEARQLLEEIPECLVVWSSGLVSHGIAAAERRGDSHEMRSLTRGIPSLMRSLGDTRASSALPQAFYDAFGELVAASVRRSLIDEELRLRLAMLLLGRGTVEDLIGVIGKLPQDVMASLRADAPLFGVASSLESFECLCCHLPLALSAALPRLSTLCALFPDVLESSARMLVSNGEYRRAAALYKMLGCGGADEVVLAHGAEFLEVGEVSLVRRALMGSTIDLGRGAVSSLGAALAAVARRGKTEKDRLEVSVSAESDRFALLFVDARRVLRAEPPLVSRPEALPGLLAQRASVHLEACSLLTGGHPSAALRLLVAHPRSSSEMTVSSALLDLDFEVARLLVGDREARGVSRPDEAARFLSATSLEGLSGYASLASLIRAVVTGDASAAAEADVLMARSERSGDRLAQVVALLAGCVCDLRAKASARANVRSLLAETVAEKSSLGYLGRVARLLGDVARFLMGESLEMGLEDGPRDDLSAVRSLVRAAIALREDASLAPVVPEDVPRDALWLVSLLATGIGEFSGLVRERMPQGWRRALATIEEGEDERTRDGRGVSVCELAGLDRPPLGDPTVPIEVTLLGGFAVYVRGVRIADSKLEQRSAKSMLEYLVLRHGACAKRFQLVEQVWPDCDYVSGFNRAYQATSSLRAAIAEIDPSLDPFLASRSSREVSLDMGLVRCDVDVFRALAREASDSRDPARSLTMARQAERLYAGDLYLPPVDALGYVSAVRDELKELYADAMVAGGDAALRLGQERTAARLAANALMANDLREDAVIVLVRALRASGRAVEADLQYRHYNNRLRRAGKHTPSGRLKQVMEEAGPTSPSVS